MASSSCSPLPPPSSLVWSHATNSKAKLDAALSDPTITAIEADILMGYDRNVRNGDIVAIMSHPPHELSDLPYEQSDLSAEQFLDTIFQGMRTNGQKRHIKLDFKEVAVVKPVLHRLWYYRDVILQYKPTIFLNADILEGPGVRGPDVVTVRPEPFILECLGYIGDIAHAWNSSPSIRQYFAFSLGYKCNYKSKEPYTTEDASSMAKISERESLDSLCGGVVLALNARTLALDPTIFDEYLTKFASSQILAWTGAGEDPIPQALIDEIKGHYETTGCAQRVGFDCDIAKELTNK